MAGGGGGAVGMRLNIMTALYLPILGYAMSTFDLNPDALVIKSDNLSAYAVAENKLLSVGEEFAAHIMYELVPTEAQQSVTEEGEEKAAESHAKGAFEPDVVIDYSVSPEGMVYDTVRKEIVFNTADVFDGEPESIRQKTVFYKLKIIGKSAAGLDYYREVENSFEVFKPYVDVQSNAAPRLLAGCENSLKFNVPGVDVNTLVLRDRSTGKEVEGGTITWTPKGDTTVISVSRKVGEELKFIDNKGFKITPPPPPSVFIRSAADRAKALGPQDMVTLLDDFELVIKPDQNFLVEYPNDARYTFNEMRISVSRPGLAPQEGTVPASQLNQDRAGRSRGEIIYSFNLIDALGGVPRGTGMSIVIDGVQRINYQGSRFNIDPTSIPTQFSYRAQ